MAEWQGCSERTWRPVQALFLPDETILWCSTGIKNIRGALKPYFRFKKSLQEGFVKEKRRRHRRRCPCYPCCLLYNISLHFVPHPLSSRNCSGSSSGRSMEIWVHAVYVIVASINALLICSGLQSSIRIVHLHARTHANTHARTLGLKTDASLRKTQTCWQQEKWKAGKAEQERRPEREDNKQPAAASLFVFSLSIVTVLIGCTHHQIYIHITRSNAESPKYQ